MSKKELAKARARLKQLEAQKDIYTIAERDLRFMRDSLAGPKPATEDEVEALAASHRTIARLVDRLERESVQPVKAAKQGVANRNQANVDRDRRIHDAHSAGVPQKTIALDENLSESTVSRVLDKPRP